MPALHSTASTSRFLPVRLRQLAAVLLLIFCVGALGAAYEVHRYNHIVDRRLARNAMLRRFPRFQAVAQRGHTGRQAPWLQQTRIARQRVVPAYAALPPELVGAVIAIEDRRFFEHGGVNYVRTAECAVQDAVTFSMACGGSTLTQQLARNVFLTQKKSMRRKVEEVLIARRLEARFSKQQIFAMYATQINLGQRGPAPIRGFAEASQAYFGKPLRELDLAQCALLAGMIQRPNFYNPYRHPVRAAARRNIVLDAMVSTGAITRPEASAAKAEPLNVAGLPFDDVSSPIQMAFAPQ